MPLAAALMLMAAGATTAVPSPPAVERAPPSAVSAPLIDAQHEAAKDHRDDRERRRALQAVGSTSVDAKVKDERDAITASRAEAAQRATTATQVAQKDITRGVDAGPGAVAENPDRDDD